MHLSDVAAYATGSRLPEPLSGGVACLEQSKVAPSALLGHHLPEPAAHLGSSRSGHDREAHAVVAEFLQDCAGLARAQVEERCGEVLGVEKSCACTRRETRLEHETNVV